MTKHRLKLNGKFVTSAEFHRDGPVGAPGVPMITRTYSEANPLVSDGIGCLKSQVPKMRKMIKRRGIVGARVLDNGQVEFTSHRARTKLLDARGLVDNDGGYGDG